ncbi:DNA polymerase 1 [uncultured archaeon]|nr:DNA polymerase 1 [uncultured archaeon]
MIFQILDANYAYDNQRNPLVQLFGTTPEGKSVTCRVAGFRPYFYAGVEDGWQKSAAETLAAMGLEVEEILRFEPIGFQKTPKKMLKITATDPKEVRVLREKVREVPGIKTVYETDILFKNRFLIDQNLGGMGWVEAPIPEWAEGTSGHTHSGSDAPLVNVSTLHPILHEANAPMRFMSFDIECLPDHGEMPRADRSPVILISMAF